MWQSYQDATHKVRWFYILHLLDRYRNSNTIRYSSYHCSLTGSLTVIDGHTHNNILTSGESVPLGTQIILVCRVVGLPYGTPLSYTWTCPNGPCEVEGYYGRKIYNEHILVVNTTSTSDGGTYTCQVTAKRQEATGSFTLTVTGMCVCLVLYYIQ